MDFEDVRLLFLLTTRCREGRETIGDVIESIEDDIYNTNRHINYILSQYSDESKLSKEDKEKIKKDKEDIKEYRRMLNIAEAFNSIDDFKMPVVSMVESVGIMKAIHNLVIAKRFLT